MPKKVKHLCQKEACAIQTCLKDNNFKEEACLKVIQEMIECCQKVNFDSYICKGFDGNKADFYLVKGQKDKE